MKKNQIKSKTRTDVRVEKVIDVSGRSLGRVASEVAFILMGKNNVSYKRNIYSGSPVKVINSSKLRISAKKLSEIYHTRYSGYPGGLKILTGTYTAKKNGVKELIKLAIYQMLPDNKLRKEMMKNLILED